ncbi:MAG: methyltransferase domain-containing protein [Gammaproteobacteria bacterium]|nr:methyltransferase domain-containing protein [Gammaproteobacteria bacterium]
MTGPDPVQRAARTKEAIKGWWADFPMTYGDVHGDTAYQSEGGQVVNADLGSPEFFDRADERFYQWNLPLHDGAHRFGRLFEYVRFRGKAVLEVGCGMGCMAMNWAREGASVTAVDLNPVAVRQTRRRFELFGLEGRIEEADAEALPFEDDTFDYAYSWGVLHHTSGTREAVAEIYRVLRPGGEVGVMLYNRKSLLFRLIVRYQEGLVNLERSFLDPLGLASRYGDGDRAEGNPHTWPVTLREVRRDLFPQFRDLRVRVLGTDVRNVLNILYPELGSRLLPEPVVKALARRWGWSLWITGRKAT